MSKKEIPKIIRRYFLLVGISLGMIIGYVISFVPKSEVFFSVLILFILIVYTITQKKNKVLFEKWGIIPKKENRK